MRSRLIAGALSFRMVVFALVGSCALAGDSSLRQDAGGPEREPRWPGGLGELQFHKLRVFGDYGSATNSMTYRGTTDALNAFIDRYSRLDGVPLSLVLHCGRGEVVKHKENTHIPIDWKLTVCFRTEEKAPRLQDVVTTGMEVWVGCQIDLNTLKVPRNVPVQSGGEIERFVEAHLKKRNGR